MAKFKPTKFMAEDSKYNKAAADYAVNFIQCLSHTKGTWAGKPFELIDWQEQIIRDLFGILKPNGYRQFNTAYIEIPKKNGKQLSLDTLIPTPDGFTTMGEIQVGDTVFDENGNMCHVVAKSKVDFKEQAYRITFKDDQIIDAGEQHQWCGEYTSGKRKKCIMTTGELFRMPRDNGSFRFRIAVAQPIQTAEIFPPIEPYLMGYWLGNGNAVKPEITVQTCDISGVLSKILPFYPNLIAWNNVGNSVIFRIPELKKILMKSFHDKIIPTEYLRSSYYQRLELLQGLMDSDGCVSEIKGQAIYTSTEKKLAESVSELLWSLGIKNTISTAISTQRMDWNRSSHECGRTPTGETLYYVKFTAFDDMKIVGLRRKDKNQILQHAVISNILIKLKK